MFSKIGLQLLKVSEIATHRVIFATPTRRKLTPKS
jgi:hypothetical protein